MKYCSKCLKLYENSLSKCKICKNKLTDHIKDTDPVLLINSSGFELERIKSSLDDYNISYMEKPEKYHIIENVVTGGNNIASAEIFVNYDNLEKANCILVGIGAKSPEDISETDVGEEKISTETESSGEMSPGKKALWRIISVILFFILMYLTVHGVDILSNLFKSLF